MSIPAVAARWIVFVFPRYNAADWYIDHLEQKGMDFLTGKWRVEGLVLVDGPYLEIHVLYSRLILAISLLVQ
jgi:hypothetical protein